MNDSIDTGDSSDASVADQVQTSAHLAVQQEPATGGSYTRIPETGGLIKNEPADTPSEQE